MNVTDANMQLLVDEYRTLVAEAGLDRRRLTVNRQRRLTQLLATEAEWTPRAAGHLVSLARNYGSFVLRNALALAEAMDIEDGSAGL